MSAVYFIRAAESGHVKIGLSHSPVQRLRELERMCPLTLSLEAAIFCGDEPRKKVAAQSLERKFHQRHIGSHWRGEWFRSSPQLDADIVAVAAGTFDFDCLPTPTPASLFRPISRHGRPRKGVPHETGPPGTLP